MMTGQKAFRFFRTIFPADAAPGTDLSVVWNAGPARIVSVSFLLTTGVTVGNRVPLFQVIGLPIVQTIFNWLLSTYAASQQQRTFLQGLLGYTDAPQAVGAIGAGSMLHVGLPDLYVGNGFILQTNTTGITPTDVYTQISVQFEVVESMS